MSRVGRRALRYYGRSHPVAVLLTALLRQTIACAIACAVFVVGVADARGETPLMIDGDPIGSDSSLTDNTGGFTAMRTAGGDMGLPAIQIALDGELLLTELRVVVFGLPSPEGQLRFDDFDFHLDFWNRDAYFAGDDPFFSMALGDPMGIELIQRGPEVVVPETPFGTSGPVAGDAETYDLHFDLSLALIEAHQDGSFPARPPEGDWVVGFQSRHELGTSGTLRVTGSSAENGPLPLFSRGDIVPRGILGGQDPENILLHWGMALSAVQALPGDGDGDNDVDADDVEIWQGAYGNNEGGDTDWDGDSDGVDFLRMQRLLGSDISDLLTGFDVLDLEQWAASFGVDAGGDADWDLDTDGRDFLLWQRNLSDAGISVVARRIPAPTAGVLGYSALISLLCRGPMRRRRLAALQHARAA